MRIVTGILAAACILAAPPDTRADEAQRGKALYDTYCTQCHGMSGNGKGANMPHLSVQPRDHTDRAEMSARSDEELFKAIKHGGQAVNKSVLMPNWDGNLTDAEIRDLVAYLRRLCCQATKQEQP